MTGAERVPDLSRTGIGRHKQNAARNHRWDTRQNIDRILNPPFTTGCDDVGFLPRPFRFTVMVGVAAMLVVESLDLIARVDGFAGWSCPSLRGGGGLSTGGLLLEATEERGNTSVATGCNGIIQQLLLDPSGKRIDP